MGEENIDNVPIDEEVFQILKESLKIKLQKDRKPQKVQVNNALRSTIYEFLTCYTLFVYDLDGVPVGMTIYGNALEKNAMDNLFLQKFGEFVAVRNTR